MIQTWNERAHAALKGKTGMLLAWSFACALIVEVGAVIDPTLYGTEMGTSFEKGFVLLISGILSFMLYPVIIGYYWVLLETVREKDIQFTDLFLPMRRRYDKHVAATILLTVLQLLWTLLFLVPGIVKYFSYAFTYFILHDEPELSVRAAITKSRALTRGLKWDAFKLILPVVPVYLIGLTLFFRFDSVLFAALSLLIATALIRPLVVSRFAVMYEDARREYDEQWKSIREPDVAAAHVIQSS
ncbi:DUF975 family protein [Exiguobacterium sp. ZOR0005]|uniref:DUF975 family protein n=1 Tax=Exiguobacterium sp. ZOR0005 TaxID=1339226 RepID=UPI00068DED67|nr:DUF975 family protein [Exiguobacterium sp. ZOR0005]